MYRSCLITGEIRMLAVITSENRILVAITSEIRMLAAITVSHKWRISPVSRHK